MLPHHRHRPISWAAWAIACLLLIGVPAACHYSLAQSSAPGMLRLSGQACEQLGLLVRRIAEARDGGATQRQVLDTAIRELDGVRATGAFRRIVLGEIRRVYTSAQPPAALEVDAYTRCVSGPMGAEET